MFEKDTFKSTKVDGVDGVVTLTYDDKKAFIKGDDTVTGADLKKVAEYTSKYIEEATNNASREAKSIMEDDSKIKKVIIKYPFSTSKRGGLDVTVDRSKTFKGMQGRDDVTKSTVRVTATDPVMKMPKTKIRDLEESLTSALLL